MEVILLEHVNKLGKMGDKVTVKNGYARNYLLPTKKALRATEANLAVYEKQKAGFYRDSGFCKYYLVFIFYGLYQKTLVLFSASSEYDRYKRCSCTGC